MVSHVNFDPDNLFVYLPVDCEIAFLSKEIMKRENLRIRHSIFFKLQAAFHISITAGNEHLMLRKENVEEMSRKWENTPIVGIIDKLHVYQKGPKLLIALTVNCEAVFKIREDLGLPRCPETFTIHTTLLEKKLW